MMKIACLLLLVFICIFINKVNAQAGYIITQKNDTVKGELKIRAFGRPVFKPANKVDFTAVNIDTLKEYQLKDSSVWVAKTLPTTSMNFYSKPQFVLLLEKGKISLYQQTGTDRYHLRTWYVAQNPDSLVAIKTDDIFLAGGSGKKGRKEILSNMFADQPDIQAAFNATGKFDFDTIRLYIHKYNKGTVATSK